MGCGNSKVVNSPDPRPGGVDGQSSFTNATAPAPVHPFGSEIPESVENVPKVTTLEIPGETAHKHTSRQSASHSFDVDVFDFDGFRHTSAAMNVLNDSTDGSECLTALRDFASGGGLTQPIQNTAPKFTTVSVPSSISSAVSLKYLLDDIIPRTEELAQELGVTEVSAGTFWELVIRPVSEDARNAERSYVSAADLSGSPLIPRSALLPSTARKPHTVYVIYYHTMPLQTVVAALQQYFQHHTRMGTDTYVWLDILAVDLTAPLDLSHATSAIAAASKVALIIDDHADVFSRAWCLFEVWWAHHAHSHRGPPSTWLHVLPTGYQSDSMALVEALFAASFADAKCTLPTDHAALLACMREAQHTGQLSARGDSHIAMTVVDTVWAVLLQHVQRAPHSTRGETAVDTVCMLSVNIMHAYACRQRKRYREAEKHLNAALSEARRMAPPAAAAPGAGPAPKHQRLHAAATGTSGTLAVVWEAAVEASPPGSPARSASSGSDQPLLSLVRPSIVLAEAASTAASMQFASASEEVQQLVFRATVDLARCCFEQGRMQEATEHARRATQFAYQGHTSATSSAAASVLLGEIYSSVGNHGAALSSFTTAMTVLTQHGLRTRQGGAVMRHIGRCFLQQEEFRRARSHLNEALKILSDILPKHHPELDAVREDLAALHAQRHRHDAVITMLAPLHVRRRPAFPDPAATLRRLALLAAALSELRRWRAMVEVTARAVKEAAAVWTCFRNLGLEPKHLQPSAAERQAVREEVQAHLVALVTLACHCLHSAAPEEGGDGMLPVAARASIEVMAWNGHQDDRVAAGLLLVAAVQQNAGRLREAMYVYFSCHQRWEDWRQLSKDIAAHAVQAARSTAGSAADSSSGHAKDRNKSSAGHRRSSPPQAVPSQPRARRSIGGPQDGGHTPPSCSPTSSSLRSSYEASDSGSAWPGDPPLQPDLTMFWDRSSPQQPGGDAPPQLPPPSRLGCLRSLAGTLYARGEVTAELGVLWHIVAMADEGTGGGRSSSSSGCRAREAPPGGPATPATVDEDGYVVDSFERDSANARTLVIVRRRIGSCLVSLGRAAEAAEELRACVATARALLSNAAADPDVLAAQVMLGSVLHRTGELGKAQRQLELHLPVLLAEPAHANSPLVRQGLLALGDCLARCKRHDEAVQAFRDAAAMFKAAGLPDGHGKALQQAMKCQEALVDSNRRPRMLGFGLSQRLASVGGGRRSHGDGNATSTAQQVSSDGG